MWSNNAIEEMADRVFSFYRREVANIWMEMYTIEQTFLFALLRVRDDGERRGENSMVLRPAVLLCGAILIAGAPVWADGIASPVFAKAFPDLNIPALGRSSLKLGEPVNADMSAKSVRALMFGDRFDANNAIEGWDSARSEGLVAPFPELSDRDTRSVGLGDAYSDDVPSHIVRVGKAWWMKEDRDKDKDRERDWHGGGARPTQVPEPGSFSLLLIGLATFGIFGLRRR
jgi:PEP-CTERM motif